MLAIKKGTLIILTFGLLLNLLHAEESNRDNELLNVVKQSPILAKRATKAEWLNLYAKGATVEDPVGSGIHYKSEEGVRRKSDLGNFFDAFIAPNKIDFEVQEDQVFGDYVIRKVLIHTKISGKTKIDVPTNLVYKLKQELDENNKSVWKIESLKAFWPLSSMINKALHTRRFPLDFSTMGYRLLRHLGVKSTFTYMKGLSLKGEGIKESVRSFFDQSNLPSSDESAQTACDLTNEVKVANEFQDIVKSNNLTMSSDVIVSKNFATLWVENDKKEKGFVIFEFLKNGEISSITYFKK